jgi:hypothetical protein
VALRVSSRFFASRHQTESELPSRHSLFGCSDVHTGEYGPPMDLLDPIETTDHFAQRLLHDYGVAQQSRTSFSCRPDLLKDCPAGVRSRKKQRAVAIDYPRSQWRIGGNPLAGRNRVGRVGASRSWSLGACSTRSPPLDSRHLAFSDRSTGSEESERVDPERLHAPAVLRLVTRAIAP